MTPCAIYQLTALPPPPVIVHKSIPRFHLFPSPLPLQVEEGDEGRYLCEAENGVNDPLAAVVNLKVNGKKQTDIIVARIHNF